MPRDLDADSHIFLIDGSGFIFRAFHALPPLTRKSDGLPVGAVAGFCNMLWKMLSGMSEEDKPTHLAVIFDKGSMSFRNEIYPAYKAQRPPPPEDLVPQFSLIRDATRAFGLPCVELEGYEADDLIATYSAQAVRAGAQVTVISSDKDLMQLVGDRVDMFDPMKEKRIGEAEVVEKFGVLPNRVVDVQALAGDSVDNVPGAPGIGVKTAAQLIEQFGDLDALLARAEEIKQPKRRQTLIDHADQIRISRDLVRLDVSAPAPESLEQFELTSPDPAPLISFLKEMEFRTLTRRIGEALGARVDEIEASASGTLPGGDVNGGGAGVGAAPALTASELPIDPANYEIVRDEEALSHWITEIRERGWVAVDTETTSLDEMKAELVGVCLAVEPGRACYIPLGHVTGEGDLLGAKEHAEGQLPFHAVLEALKPVLEDQAVLKIGQNLKYDMKVLANYGIALDPIDDTMLLSYVLASGLRSHGMDRLSDELLDHQPISIKDLIGSGKSQITFDRVPIDKAAAYAAEDADVTLRLHKLMKPQLIRDRLATVYETLERPLVPVLAAMEREGIHVDRDRLSRLSNSFSQRMAGLEADIHELAGETFNVGSPKQLGEIMFDRLGLQDSRGGSGKKTKTGAYATGADVLEELAALGHDLPTRVLDWRQLSKLKGTYTDALQEHINADTGRVHTSFSMAATSTGRLASTDPNLQNIPVRSEEGRQIREAFTPAAGKTLLSLDYSQIELRILAHIAEIEPLRQAFRDGLDIHAMTASEVFGVPIEGMDPMVRRQAKAINFGVIYGISAYGLSNNLRIPQGEAKKFIDAYFEKFPGIRAYMDATVARAKEVGYVETLFGRRIHTPEINVKGPRGGFAWRAAINAPIQGAAADIIRRAMVRIPDVISANRLPARMLLQVHDELLFEVDEGAVEEVSAVLKDVMEKASKPTVELAIPLTVDAGWGGSWAEAH
ncbi:MAG: DNA polymerase I [Rhodobacteraceae bacterium]|nr:DNA polymerase I [Paracoccaceae bacterium]